MPTPPRNPHMLKISMSSSLVHTYKSTECLTAVSGFEIIYPFL